MLPFNKRFRETTLIGMRYSTLGGFAGSVVSLSFSGIALFNLESVALTFFLVLVSLSLFVFAVKDLRNNADHRIKRMRIFSMRDKKYINTGM